MNGDVIRCALFQRIKIYGPIRCVIVAGVLRDTEYIRPIDFQDSGSPWSSGHAVLSGREARELILKIDIIECATGVSPDEVSPCDVVVNAGCDRILFNEENVDERGGGIVSIIRSERYIVEAWCEIVPDICLSQSCLSWPGGIRCEGPIGGEGECTGAKLRVRGKDTTPPA